jgi:hypothetical protein
LIAIGKIDEAEVYADELNGSTLIIIKYSKNSFIKHMERKEVFGLNMNGFLLYLFSGNLLDQ